MTVLLSDISQWANWWSQSLEKSVTKLSLQSSVAVHRHLMGARSAGHAVSCQFFEFGFVHVAKFGEHARGVFAKLRRWGELGG